MLKRAGVTAVVALAASAILLPWWLGTRAERAFARLALAIEAQPGVAVIEQRYARGWLRGTGTLRLAAAEGAAPVDLRWQAGHGPWPPARLARGRFVPAALAVELRAVGPDGDAAPVLQVSAHVTLAGTVHGEFAAADVKAPIDPQRRLALAGARGSFTLRPREAGEQLAIEASVDGFRVEAPDAVTELAGARIDALGLRRGRALEELSLQRWHLTADSLRLEPRGNGAPLVLARVDIDARWSAPSGLADGRVRARSGSVNAGGRELGAFSLALDAERIDMDALQRLNRRIAAARAVGNSMPRADMLNALAAVAASGAAVTLSELTLETDDGRLQAHGELRVDGAHPELGIDTVALVEATHARMQVTGPATLLRAALTAAVRRRLQALHGEAADPAQIETMTSETVDAQVEDLVARGILRRDGEHYLLEAALDGGRLTVNNQHAPPSPHAQ